MIIAQTEPSPAQLLRSTRFSLAKVIDDLQLVLIHPAGDRDRQEPERLQRLQHRITHYRGPGLAAANRGRFNRIQLPDRTGFLPDGASLTIEGSSNRVYGDSLREGDFATGIRNLVPTPHFVRFDAEMGNALSPVQSRTGDVTWDPS